MKQIKTVFIEDDDDTYIYGNRDYTVEIIDGVYIEPFIHVELNKIIKFYRKENFFAIYENNILTEIIHTMTCWSDDIIAYKLRSDGIAYEYSEMYHGRPKEINKECNINLNAFIDKFNLRKVD